MQDNNHNLNPKDSGIPTVNLAPPIEIEAFEEYLLGFPMVIAITFKNLTATHTYGYLPKIDLFKATTPVKFVFVSLKNHQHIELPVASTHWREDWEREANSFALFPGESRQMLFDLSELNPLLSPGTYRLEAIFHRRGLSTAPPVKVRIIDPSPSDSTLAAILRKYNDLMEPSWSYFLLYNWRTINISKQSKVGMKDFPRIIDASDLSSKGKEALAFHLFLHRAIYGPTRIADLNLKELEVFAKGPLKGEAAVLRFEILTARKDPSAAIEETKILEQYPGLKWRVEEIKEGYGLLTYLRSTRGAEQRFETKPPFFPYTNQERKR